MLLLCGKRREVMSHSVTVRDVVKYYGDFLAADHLNLKIKEGEFFTLLGPSGCGKTTLLRMIAGFNTIEGGEILFDEKVINNMPAHKRDIGMVFQNYAIFPHLTVYDNVAYGLKARNVSSSEINKRVMDALELVQIANLKDRKPNELSGGQQQRVALARAFVIEPTVLLMDEPLSNLDAKLRVQMRTEIRRIQQALGITAIYVTHDQSEAMAISDQVILMKGGVIAQMGTPMEIYYRPNSEFVADFIGECNFLKGKVGESSNGLTEIELPAGKVCVKTEDHHAAGADGEIVLRPEAIQIGDEGMLPCRVELSCFMGSYQNYHVRVGDTLVKITDNCPVNKKIYNVGDQAFISFDPNCAHLLDT